MFSVCAYNRLLRPFPDDIITQVCRYINASAVCIRVYFISMDIDIEAMLCCHLLIICLSIEPEIDKSYIASMTIIKRTISPAL